VTAGPVALVALALSWNRRWVSDDGFIYLRVARNITEGAGPVFNPGERVEAATGTIWVWLVAVLHAVTQVRLEYVAVALGLVCTVMALLATQAASARFWKRAGLPSRWWLPAGVLVVALWPPLWDFATSGLETSLVLLWIAVVWWLLVSVTPADKPWRRRVEVVCVSMSWLVRPDLAVMGVVVLAGWWLVRSSLSRRSRLVDVTVGLVPVVCYQVFRMAYYGALAPNPALAKEATTPRVSRGIGYLWDAGAPYGTWLLVAVAVAALVVFTVKRPWHQVAPAVVVSVAGVTHLAYVAYVGGDFMHARMAIPGVFALLATWSAVIPARRWTAPVALVAVVAFVVAVASRPVHLDPGSTGIVGRTNSSGVVDERFFWLDQTGTTHLVTVEDYANAPSGGQLAATIATAKAAAEAASAGRHGLVGSNEGRIYLLPADLSVDQPVALEAGNIGVVGFLAGPDVYLADDAGLTDPAIARTTMSSNGRPGHEKFVERAWTLAAAGVPVAAVEGAGADAAAQALADTTAARSCGWLGDLTGTVSGPFTLSSAFEASTHAVPWWFSRLPASPASARRELCSH
jgi:arabinofuranosyltransferase